jgi:hypothetical protein
MSYSEMLGAILSAAENRLSTQNPADKESPAVTPEKSPQNGEKIKVI